MRNSLVYDLPTRLFHWLFALLFIGSFAITKLVDNESQIFTYHMLFGLTMCFIVLLRIGWGIFGSQYAKFSSFILNPKMIFRYFADMFSDKAKRSFGHNPATSWASILMMLLAICLGFTGYMMTGTSYKEAFEDLHEIIANIFLIIVILHITGIILHTLRHKEAIGLSMIDGKKQPVDQNEPINSPRPIAGIIFVALVVLFSFNLFRNYNLQKRNLNFFGASLQLGENESKKDDFDKTEDDE